MPRKESIASVATKPGLDLGHAIPRCNGSDPGKRARFFTRFHEMVSHGTWIYYPERDLFCEKVSIQSAKWNSDQPGRPRFMPALEVYGRDVYECPEWKWKLFLEYHPHAVVDVHARFNKPSEGGIIDPDAIAVHFDGEGEDRMRA